MPKYTKLDIVGKRFGRLITLSFLPDKGRWSAFLFQCDCGAKKRILAQAVLSGVTASCGCLQKDLLKLRSTHGHSGKGRSKTYNSWAGMMDRCEWGGHPVAYPKYGGRGIRVCERWHDFKNFLADMGERPQGTSIDRIDGSKGYSPDNCRWATTKEQNMNTNRNIKLKYNGGIITFCQLVIDLDLNVNALRSRAARRGRDYVLALRSVGVECDYLV
jgi:hypothetical protein